MSSTEAHDERYVDNNGTEDTFDTQDGVRKVIAAQFVSQIIIR